MVWVCLLFLLFWMGWAGAEGGGDYGPLQTKLGPQPQHEDRFANFAPAKSRAAVEHHCTSMLQRRNFAVWVELQVPLWLVLPQSVGLGPRRL